MTPEQEQFLKEGRLGVLATGRRDGSPQQALIAYDYDGTDIVIQTGGQSVKARNIARLSRVCLLVADGGRNLAVYGSAEVLTGGAERRVAIRRARSRTRAETPDDDAALDAELDERGTVALRIVPERAMGRIEERRS